MITRFMLSLILCSWQAVCFSEEWPNEEKLLALLKSGQHNHVENILTSYRTKKANPSSDEDLAFLLSVVSESMSYRVNVTIEDYQLFIAASRLVAESGDGYFKYQAVLLNRLAQDSQLFDSLDMPTQTKIRKEIVSLFVDIYERAQNRRDIKFDAQKIRRDFSVPPELLDRMIDADIEFDQDGNPFGKNYAGKIKEEYLRAKSEHDKLYAEMLIQKGAQRILDKDNVILIKRIFTERYQRAPVDYLECYSFLSRIAGAPVKDIICAIELATQVKVPKRWIQNPPLLRPALVGCGGVRRSVWCSTWPTAMPPLQTDRLPCLARRWQGSLRGWF